MLLITLALLLNPNPVLAKGGNPSALGLDAFRHGRMEEAIQHFEMAVKQAPRSAAVWTDYGFMLAQAYRRDEAEKAFRTAIEVDPSRPHAYVNLVDMLATDANWPKREELRQLLLRAHANLKTGPGKHAVLLRLAALEQSLGRAQDARARLDSLDPETLPPALHRRWHAVREALETDQQLRGMDDWPEPQVDEKAVTTLERARTYLAQRNATAALVATRELDACCLTWSELRRLRAQAYSTLERHDDAMRELTTLVQLRLSDARTWRDLGLLLSERGGPLEADRADHALREALALEPSWSHLWLTRARLALRRRRPEEALAHLDRLSHRQLPTTLASERDRIAAAAKLSVDQTHHANTAVQRVPAPSDAARSLFRSAQDLMGTADPNHAAKDLLEQALNDSPAYVEAAAALFSVTGSMWPRTLEMIDGDAQALLALASLLVPLDATAPSPSDGAASLALRCMDRAVKLGSRIALWDRARFLAARGERERALSDLEGFVQRDPDPNELAQARHLRGQLTASPQPGPIADERLARFHLGSDKPEDAVGALGACSPDHAPSRLLALARVHEFSGSVSLALECYQAAVTATPDPTEHQRVLERLARVAVETPAQVLQAYTPLLEQGASSGIPEARWTLARMAEADGDTQRALEWLLHPAPLVTQATWMDDVKAMQERLRGPTRSNTDPMGGWYPWWVVAATLGALWLLLWRRWFHGSTVADAVLRKPALHPRLARAIGELRHDVLKHRASVLELLPGADDKVRADVVNALEQPIPADRVVMETFQQLEQAALHHGIKLRRLMREPAFGPLYRDMQWAREHAMKRQCDAQLASLAKRMTTVHQQELAELLKLGPTTRVDGTVLTGWMAAVEMERRHAGRKWTPPSLFLQEAALEFPVEPRVLATVFANLLRNAQSAVESIQEGRVLVRLAEERDSTGRRVMVLLVGDSAPSTVTLEQIDCWESGRGLAIIRDLVHEWRGRILVRPETEPWNKGIGACFPA